MEVQLAMVNTAGVFLDVIGTKLLHAIHSHLYQQFLLSPSGFLGLEISITTAEIGFGLKISTVLSFISLYLYIKTSLPHRNNK
jgi:hypothetical protein